MLTYPSPNPTLTLTCYQLIVVGLREGQVCSRSDNIRRKENPTFEIQCTELVGCTLLSIVKSLFLLFIINIHHVANLVHSLLKPIFLLLASSI